MRHDVGNKTGSLLKVLPGGLRGLSKKMGGGDFSWDSLREGLWRLKQDGKNNAIV